MTKNKAKGWGDNTPTIELELPSGNKPDVYVPSYLDLWENGQPPKFLDAVGKDLEQMDSVDGIAATTSAVQTAERLIMQCFVNPKVVREGADPDKGQINLSDINSKDKEFLFNWLFAQMGVTGIDVSRANKSFAPQDGSIPTLADESGVPVQTE